MRSASNSTGSGSSGPGSFSRWRIADGAAGAHRDVLDRHARSRAPSTRRSSSLDRGELRVADPPVDPSGEWLVHAWVKKAILLYFRLRGMETHRGRALRVPRQDPAQERARRAGRARRAAGPHPLRRLLRAGRRRDARLREHRRVRRRAARWSTPGRPSARARRSGANVHLSGGVGIGGVLEPPGARPVIVEDGAFIGSRSIVVEGVRVGREAVLGANVVLTASTPIVDVRGKTEIVTRGRVPAARGGHPRHAPEDVPRRGVRRAVRAHHRRAHGEHRQEDLAQPGAARVLRCRLSRRRISRRSAKRSAASPRSRATRRRSPTCSSAGSRTRASTSSAARTTCSRAGRVAVAPARAARRPQRHGSTEPTGPRRAPRRRAALRARRRRHEERARRDGRARARSRSRAARVRRRASSSTSARRGRSSRTGSVRCSKDVPWLREAALAFVLEPSDNTVQVGAMGTLHATAPVPREGGPQRATLAGRERHPQGRAVLQALAGAADRRHRRRGVPVPRGDERDAGQGRARPERGPRSVRAQRELPVLPGALGGGCTQGRERARRGTRGRRVHRPRAVGKGDRRQSRLREVPRRRRASRSPASRPGRTWRS